MSDELTTEFLSENELEIFSELGHDKRKNEFLSGRKLFRDMVDEIGWNYSTIDTDRDELGKPSGYLDGNEIQLSYTHSNQLMLCACSLNRPIGIDIEDVYREIKPDLVNRLANEDEKELLPVLQLWTVKEAALKMKGIGIRMDLKSLKVVQNQNHLEVLFSDDSMCEFCTFEHQNHFITLAFT